MANPQAEDGFVMIALDLFVAIMATDLPNDQRIVLAEVLLNSYGPKKVRRVHLDHFQIEHYTGLHRNNARAGIKGLIASKILIANDDGSYTFNKDWEAHEVKGKTLAARLGGGLVRFARSAVSRFGRIKASTKGPIQPDFEPINGSEINPIQPDCEKIQLDSETSVRPNPTGFVDNCKTESGWIGPNAYATGVRGRCTAGADASEDKKIKDKKKEDSPLPLTGGAGDGDEIRALEQWAEGLPGRQMDHLGTWVGQMAGQYPAAWIRDAILEAVSADPRRLKSYAHGCLKRWHAAGKPDLKAEEQAIRSAKAPRPTADPASNILPMPARRKVPRGTLGDRTS